MAERLEIILGASWWPVLAVVAVLVIVVVLEARWPALARQRSAPERHRANVMLGILTLAVQAATVGVAAAVAAAAVRLGFTGVFPALGLSGWWLIALSLLTISLASYAQHRASHRWAWLWRLHRVHHVDTALDITTAFRHHPLEPIVTAVWLSVVAALCGLSPLALLIYATLVVLLAIPQHADLSIGRAEGLLGGWLVTPGVHHVHHSAHQAETDSNYGDVITLWDRAFGSWQVRSPEARQTMRIGLGERYDGTANAVRAQIASAWRD